MTQMIPKTQVPVKRVGRIDPIAFFERFGVLIFMILLLIFFLIRLFMALIFQLLQSVTYFRQLHLCKR